MTGYGHFSVSALCGQGVEEKEILDKGIMHLSRLVQEERCTWLRNQMRLAVGNPKEALILATCEDMAFRFKKMAGTQDAEDLVEQATEFLANRKSE